ncbi:hypothetical protein MUP46_03595 [Patescibacteria group bacterium]|nr:hypothetical protein [Patescibacteria group bacterium]
MSPEAKRGLESYLEGTMYLPEWRDVFLFEFSKILSQAQIEMGKGVYEGLGKLGFKVEKDEASSQLLRILPTTTDYPQLIFRIYEGRGIKFLSGNQNRADRDWLKALGVDLKEAELRLSLGVEQNDMDRRNAIKVKRAYEIQTFNGLYLNLSSGSMLILDGSIR